MKFLDYVLQQTSNFLMSMPKSQRKKKGQFFTPPETAIFMASLFTFNNLSEELSILDPGSGTGMLSAAFIERLQSVNNVKKIHLTCYETDEMVLPILQTNLEFMKRYSSIEINYQIIKDDYLLSQPFEEGNINITNKDLRKYDFIIGNPPYLRIRKDDEAASTMPQVVHGAPNLYFLFAAMSLFNLKKNSEMVYILPRSWVSGAYFKAFRKYFLSNGKLEHIHLFASRDKVFGQEQVLQETIIVKIVKSQSKPEHIKITTTESYEDFKNITDFELPYDSVVAGADWYVFLPTSKEDLEVIRSINRYTQTLPEVGFRMRTGIVVDFRQKDELCKEEVDGTVPLFYSQHIREGYVNHFTSDKEAGWLKTRKKGLFQENKNYVFCKRFSSKEEKRRLQCGIYLASNYSQYKFIGTQNKINFVDHISKQKLSKTEVFGIYALLNSTLFDKYYRILNGSTQVNSTEINNVPVPPRNLIVKIGEKLLETENRSTETCDKILEEVAYGKN